MQQPLKIAGVLWMPGRVEDAAAALAALGTVKGLCSLTLYTLDPKRAFTSIPPGARILVKQSLSLSAAMSEIFADGVDQVLLLTGPVIVPADILAFAAEWAGQDPRIATVSFLSNAPGYLSFPHRNQQRPQHSPGQTAESLTKILRSKPLQPQMVHIAAPEGDVTLIGRGAFIASGGFDPAYDSNPAAAFPVTEFGLRASRRGFFLALDIQTYVVAPVDLETDAPPPTIDRAQRHLLHSAHRFFPALYDQQRDSNDGPLALALDHARAKCNGLRILVDATCLGPHETGTQVQTAALIRTLADHPRVQWVGASLPETYVPDYAKELIEHPKVRLYPAGGLMFQGAQHADILHRPFQPDINLPIQHWRTLAKRIVVTVQDIIAYRIGVYHESGASWLNYRKHFQETLAQIDGIVAISNDVERSISEEKFRVSSDRTFVVENGTDHLLGGGVELMPSAFAERGWAAAPFVVMIGTDYAHKNRDLAIKVWHELRRRGWPVRLVLAGVTVPYGASRTEEALLGIHQDDDVLVLPGVTSPERNWLLAHADLVLYPTSAEGFGLVPFEAAHLGTPTLSVSFGPLREVGAVYEGMPETWDVTRLADAGAALLADPAHAAATVRLMMTKGSVLTWKRMADRLVESYFQLLLKPGLE